MSKGQHGNKEAKKPKAVPAPRLPEVVASVLPAGRPTVGQPRPRKR